MQKSDEPDQMNPRKIHLRRFNAEGCHRRENWNNFDVSMCKKASLRSPNKRINMSLTCSSFKKSFFLIDIFDTVINCFCQARNLRSVHLCFLNFFFTFFWFFACTQVNEVSFFFFFLFKSFFGNFAIAFFIQTHANQSRVQRSPVWKPCNLVVA